MHKTLLIGWDAADWKVIHPLIEAGKMPHLAALIERGVMGNLSTLQPVLSPMLWTSIATGKRPFKHGVLGFTEPTPDGAGVQPVSHQSRTCRALWNILHQQGHASQVVGWWPSHPAEPIHGAMVSNHFQSAIGPPDQPWPLPPGTIYPPALAETLAELRINPNELPPDAILPFIPRAAEIDQESDQRLGAAAKIVAECASVHAAATWLLQHREWDLAAIYYDAIDHFCHGFMRYHPPRREHVDERDFALYSGVVEAAYRFHDMLLGGLLALVPDDTTVVICSDHGFHSDHLRPHGIPNEPAGPAIEHRDFGIFVMAGPGIRKDALVHGAGLLDITPTLLVHWGLPVGEDMDGKPLLEVFENPPEVQHIPSWDSVEGPDGRLDQTLQVAPLAAKEALDQLIALGYIEPLGEDHRAAVENTTRELKYNLARSYMDADRHLDAIPLLAELLEAEPEQSRFGIQLAQCYRSTGETQALRQLVEQLTERRLQSAAQAREQLNALREAYQAAHPERVGDGPLDLSELDETERREWERQRQLAHITHYDLDYLMGCVLVDEGRFEEALALFRRAAKADPSRPGLHLQLGEALLRLHRHTEAEAAYRKALAIDPLNAHAHLGLARALLPQRRPEPAAEHALETVRLHHHYPLAHYVLGLALLRLGKVTEAERALRVAVTQNPNFLRAHRVLARLYHRHIPNQGVRMLEHLRLCREIRRRQLHTPPPGVTPETPAIPEPQRLLGERLPDAESRADFIAVVSGLPRSGTSMLMQMVHAGGRPALTDGERSADQDNPRGYYEHAGATRLFRDSAWLDGAEGQVVKVVAQLLPALPRDHAYRVIFIERELDQVLRSQRAMLHNLGRDAARLEADELKRTYAAQLRRVKVWLAQQPHIHTLYLPHAEVIADPSASAERIARFLGGGLDVARMAACVAPDLVRQQPSARVVEA